MLTWLVRRAHACPAVHLGWPKPEQRCPAAAQRCPARPAAPADPAATLWGGQGVRALGEVVVPGLGRDCLTWAVMHSNDAGGRAAHGVVEQCKKCE